MSSDPRSTSLGDQHAGTPAWWSLAVAVALGLSTLFLQSGGEFQRLQGSSRHPASTVASNRAPATAEAIRTRTARWNAFEAGEGRPVPAFLTRYEALDRKALKSDDEMKELHHMLSSSASLEAAREYLAGIEADVSMHQTVKRIEVVDFLIEAERWDDNPKRAEAVQTMHDVVSTHVEIAGLSEKSQRALIGDKIELYNALRAADPAMALTIKRESLGSSLEKLLDFAEQSGPVNGLRVPKPLADTQTPGAS